MKKLSAGFLLIFLSLAGFAQKNPENTLLWKISGKGLEKPSYLYGTIHLLCADDAGLSDNLKEAIRSAEEVYFEVDLDNIFEMLGAMSKMKMNGDTTLRDLLNETDYRKVKNYFEEKGSMLPFSLLETYKPMLAASTLEQGSLPCDKTAMMEQVIMEEAKQHNKKIRGLETMAFQAGMLDSIPYRLQAAQLVSYIDKAGTDGGDDGEFAEMFQAYKEQNLKKLEDMLIASDAGISSFTDILLYRRNHNWVEKLQTLLPQKSLLIAVGAGHLPGEKGVIQLLRKEGYRVTPVENKINMTREI